MEQLGICQTGWWENVPCDRLELLIQKPGMVLDSVGVYYRGASTRDELDWTVAVTICRATVVQHDEQAVRPPTRAILG